MKSENKSNMEKLTEEEINILRESFNKSMEELSAAFDKLTPERKEEIERQLNSRQLWTR